MDFEIIVVDNNSKEDSTTEYLNNFPEIITVKSDANLGFSRANNLGYKYATGEYILLLNSDAYLIDSESIPLMISFLEVNHDVGIVGPNFVNVNGFKNYSYGNLLNLKRILNDAGLNFMTKMDLINTSTYKICEVNVPTQVGYLAAAGIIIKRECIVNYGLFDPNFFLYFEDMELAWRYKKKGMKSYVVPNATIVHLGGESSKIISLDLRAKINESKCYFIKKRYGSIILIFVKIVTVINRGRIKYLS
jgi:hypothetical protein